DLVVGVAFRGDPGAADPRGDDGVHRVGGREAEHTASGTAEGLQELLDDLVRAVGGPDVVAAEAVTEVAGQRLTERRELAVGVAVRRQHGVRERGDDVAGDGLGDRVRVLVDVEGVAHVLLRRPVGGESPQVVTDRQVGEGGHPAILLSTDAAPAGRENAGGAPPSSRTARGYSEYCYSEYCSGMARR